MSEISAAASLSPQVSEVKYSGVLSATLSDVLKGTQHFPHGFETKQPPDQGKQSSDLESGRLWFRPAFRNRQ